MRVTEIRGHHVGFVPAPAIGNARTMIRRRDFLLLEVVTDTGKSGWGEVFSSPDAAAAIIRSRYAQVVIGAAPARYRALWEHMVANLGYDRRGPAMMAISALDMALCDLAAQERGVGVAAMLGGALRSDVFAYGSGPFISDADEPYGHYAGVIEHALGEGYRALKPRAGVSPRADGEMLAHARKLVGPEIGLMVDINQAYTARAAIASARRMEPSDLLWIEEPVEPEDITGYAAVAGAVSTAVAGGKHSPAPGHSAISWWRARCPFSSRISRSVAVIPASCGSPHWRRPSIYRSCPMSSARSSIIRRHCRSPACFRRGAVEALRLIPMSKSISPAIRFSRSRARSSSRRPARSKFPIFREQGSTWMRHDWSPGDGKHGSAAD
ncbi:enolase C-terminal domain-like protein [Bosea vestrisii]|nr:enolase C-terminal domain-like protein [Bosea vestrisii]WID94538.1 enolase C-terminal domain-like protein [Bosea vestrisii]